MDVASAQFSFQTWFLICFDPSSHHVSWRFHQYLFTKKKSFGDPKSPIELPSGSCETWVCLKMVSTPKPFGFADHYPCEKWLFHWED